VVGSSLEVASLLVQDNQGGDGGGMAVSGSEVSLNDMVFVGNTAQEACQAYDFYANGFFYSGTACSDSGNGGGIVAHASDVDLMDCTLHEGRADSRGGGIHAVDSSLDLTRCRLSSNAADGGAGGGISTMDGTLTLEGCTLSGNSAEREGGGIYADSPATLTHCLLTGNEVESWSGCWSGTGGQPPSCWAYGGRGGGAYLQGGPGHIAHCAVTANRSKGACVHIQTQSGEGYVCEGGLGAGLFVVTDVNLEGVTVTGNLSDSIAAYDGLANADYVGKGKGGGLYLDDEHITVSNAILAYNLGDNLYGYDLTSVTWSTFYASPGWSNTNLSLEGTSTRTLEPGFLVYDEEGRPANHHLSDVSSLIDAGDPEQLDADGSRRDPGRYGGLEGAGWDLDRDGWPDYFWPGRLNDAPPGFDPGAFDVDDLNSSRH